MPNAMIVLLVLLAVGAMIGVARPDLSGRGVLVGVTVTMGVRTIAYIAANVFGVMAAKPASTGPYDATNLFVGALYGLVIARKVGQEADARLAMRIATGGAFVLAGLGNAFHLSGPDYFVSVGYTRTFHLFIMTAEVVGGAALLIPWNWLTLLVAAGLTVDMFGALCTQIRVGEPLDPAAITMLFRLALLAALCLRRRVMVAVGMVACALVAVGGAIVLRAKGPLPSAAAGR
ncbi:MAG TPA: DoxX family protein [Gemmatimonadaceae bacterium]|nr:DoxX family protein [Gemmatimonadaceae bacterium]